MSSIEEIIAFREEYRRRLRACYGRPDWLRIWAYERLLTNWRIHSMGSRVRRLVRKAVGH